MDLKKEINYRIVIHQRMIESYQAKKYKDEFFLESYESLIKQSRAVIDELQNLIK